MNRRLSVVLAMALVSAGAVGVVGADRLLGSSPSSSSSSDVLVDAWTTTDGRAAVEIAPEIDADWIAIADGPHVLIAVEPPASDIMSIPLETRSGLTLESVDESRVDVEIPAAAVRGESVESEPMEPGHYQVIAIEDGKKIDSRNLTVEPAALPNSSG